MGELSLARAVVDRAVQDLDLPFDIQRGLDASRHTVGFDPQRAETLRAQAIGCARGAARLLLRDLWRGDNIWGLLIGDAIPQEALRAQVRQRLKHLKDAGFDTGFRLRPPIRRTHAKPTRIGRPDLHERFLAIARRAR